METLNKLFPIYLSKIEEGFYKVPPLLIIEDIIKSRYKPELLEVKRNLNSSISNFNFNINTFEDFKQFDTFRKILESNDFLTEENIENSMLLQDYISVNLNSTTFTIRYPEVLIKNGNPGGEHLIRDLFMRYTFSNIGQILNGKPTMGRSTYTVSELLTHYKHSHHTSIELTEESLERFKSTCLGSGILASSVIYLSKVALSEFDELRIMAFIADIDAYIAWESLDGGPYVKISTIKNNLSTLGLTAQSQLPSLKLFTNIYTNEISTTFKNLTRKFLKENKDYFINHTTLIPTIKNRKPWYKIEYDEYELVKIITERAKKYSAYQFLKDYNHTYIVSVNDFKVPSYYTTSGTFNKELQKIRNFSKKDLTLFLFNDQPIKLKIIDDIKMEDAYAKVEEVITPILIREIIKELEELINKKNARNKFQKSQL